MAVSGYNTKLFKMTGTTGAEVTGLTSLTFPPQEVETLDCTTLADTSRSYIPGVTESGDLSAEALYTAALFATLNGYRATLLDWKVTWNDGAEATFSGILTKLEMESKIEDPQMIKFDIKLSGDITYDEGV